MELTVLGPDDGSGSDDGTGADDGSGSDDGEELTAGVSEEGTSGSLLVAAGDFLEGTSKADTIELDGAADAPIQVNGLGGDDTIDFYNPEAVLSEDDFSAMQIEDSVVQGGLGNDYLNIAALQSSIEGNEGDDHITGSTKNHASMRVMVMIIL